MHGTSNTRECFSDCIGLRVIGVLFDALPLGRGDLSPGNKTLVFSDGTGLTVGSNGSYWREPAETITRAVSEQADRLTATKREIADVIALAGSLDEASGVTK